MPMKILDYGRPNPFGDTIGGRRNLAWPVNAYRVTLPKASDDGDDLNPFERVILKLLDAVGAMDAHALADETRIPLDFLKGILLRLRDKELIDEHNAIIKRTARIRYKIGKARKSLSAKSVGMTPIRTNRSHRVLSSAHCGQ